jgi:hypothetical protein
MCSHHTAYARVTGTACEQNTIQRVSETFQAVRVVIHEYRSLAQPEIVVRLWRITKVLENQSRPRLERQQPLRPAHKVSHNTLTLSSSGSLQRIRPQSFCVENSHPVSYVIPGMFLAQNQYTATLPFAKHNGMAENSVSQTQIQSIAPSNIWQLTSEGRKMSAQYPGQTQDI